MKRFTISTSIILALGLGLTLALLWLLAGPQVARAADGSTLRQHPELDFGENFGELSMDGSTATSNSRLTGSWWWTLPTMPPRSRSRGWS
jgi:hypothetical protein